jgi:predicted transcriptional regulator
MPLRLDAGKACLAMFFKCWQVESLRYLWRIRPESSNSRAVWTNVNERLQGSISRASVINFLNHMVDEAILTYEEIIGNGGRQRIYSAKYGETEFKQHIACLVITKLLKEYPHETRKALSEKR